MDRSKGPAGQLRSYALDTEAPSIYQVALRWHRYTGLLITPFLVLLALTGAVMMLTTLQSGINGEAIAVERKPGQEPSSLAEQQMMALTEVPGGKVTEVMVGAEANETNLFVVQESGIRSLMVAVDPYANETVHTWWQGDRLYDWAKSIHSTLLMGTVGDLILETAAGFTVLLLISGCILWWPRNRSLVHTLFPRLQLRGRPLWRELHKFIGLYAAVFILIFLLSGMSWTTVWGEKFVQAWNTFPAEKWSAPSLADSHHESVSQPGESPLPWTLEQSKAPESVHHHAYPTADIRSRLDINDIQKLAKDIGFVGRYRIKYPKGEDGAWSINQDTMNGDAENPFSDRTVHVDQYSGKVLADIEFSDYPLGGKLMAVSIPLHMGLMGPANVVFNLLICAAVLVLPLVGVYLWWARTPTQTTMPTRTFPVVHRRYPLSGNILLACLGVAFPMVGVSLIILVVIDFGVRRLKLSREKRLSETF